MKIKFMQGWITACFVALLMFAPVHADALLGVIGYHIVPMQIENEESQEGQQEEEGDDTSDSDQTTVAFEAATPADRKGSTVVHQFHSAHSS